MFFTINRNVLKNIARFATDDKSRVALMGVYIEPDGANLKLTATNGHILGHCVYTPAVDTDNGVIPVMPEKPFILPTDAITRVCKIKALKTLPDRITVTDTDLISNDGTKVPYVPVDAEYCQYQNVIPKAETLVPTVLGVSSIYLSYISDIFGDMVLKTRGNVVCPIVTFGSEDALSPSVIVTTADFPVEVTRFLALIMPMRLNGTGKQMPGAKSALYQHLGETLEAAPESEETKAA